MSHSTDLAGYLPAAAASSIGSTPVHFFSVARAIMAFSLVGSAGSFAPAANSAEVPLSDLICSTAVRPFKIHRVHIRSGSQQHLYRFRIALVEKRGRAEFVASVHVGTRRDLHLFDSA